MRLLDYYLSYDFGHDQFGLKKGTLGFRTGKFKMPVTMARWLSGKQFEFTDRSVASTYFDVNRSLAWGLYGETNRLSIPISWETTIFNGFVTGGAETGSSGDLDENFAYAMRVSAEPIGNWGSGELADFEFHDRLAMRIGAGFAATTINRSGSTEFTTLRVVDSGNTLSNILPNQVDSYQVTQFALDASFKLRGWSSTFEYYFRNVSDFQGAELPSLLDHGFWFQLGYFVVPQRVQLLTRWSRVDGDSGTLGMGNQRRGGGRRRFCLVLSPEQCKTRRRLDSLGRCRRSTRHLLTSFPAIAVGCIARKFNSVFDDASGPVDRIQLRRTAVGLRFDAGKNVLTDVVLRGWNDAKFRVCIELQSHPARPIETLAAGLIVEPTRPDVLDELISRNRNPVCRPAMVTKSDKVFAIVLRDGYEHAGIAERFHL